MDKKFPHSFTAIKEGLALVAIAAVVAIAFYAIFNYKAVYSSMSKAIHTGSMSPVISSLDQQAAADMCVDEIAAEDVYFVSCGGFF